MKVLLVEDEPKISEAVRRGLENEGFKVDVAESGIDGLDRASENRYDIVVLDILLPGLNGFVVCKRLREAGHAEPILMLTAKDGEYDIAEALDTGADDYLTKPFSFVVLVARIRALLRRPAEIAPPLILRAGDLSLEPTSRRCVRGDTEIKLTEREFEVLELLMKQPNVVISKQQILDDVWDFAFAGDANIVEVYIRHLRAKIDIPFNREAIHTVRGAGYRLDSNGG